MSLRRSNSVVRVRRGYRLLNYRARYVGLNLSYLPLVTAAILLLSLKLLNNSFTLHDSPPLKYQPDKFDSLTCAQIAQIGRFGQSHYGGPAKIDLESNEFSHRVSHAFIDKLDPYKVIFLKSEAVLLARYIELEWYKSLHTGKCDDLEQVTQEHYLAAKLRTKSLIKSIPVYKGIGKYSGNDNTDMQYPKYKVRAASRSELTSRLSELGQVIIEHSSSKFLPLYQNNLHFLMTSRLQQVLFDDNPITHSLLAKSVLGAMDPYSTYMSSSEFDDFYQELSGSASGIGIKVSQVPAGLFVDKVLEDSPARRGGIKEGTVITSVDGKSTREGSLRSSLRWIKGTEGTLVQLEWIDPVGQGKYSASITRETLTESDKRIHTQIAMISGKPIAIIEIPSFYGRGGLDLPGRDRSVSEDLEEEINKLLNRKSRPIAIVLDLRGNPGGFLEEAISIAGLFLGDRPVVGVVEHSNRRVLRDYRPAVYSGPLLALLDKESASASEVLAGALKDHKRALVVGSSASYGKGSVQRLFHLQDEFSWITPINDNLWNGVVKLTTSVFYSPLGHSPANGGITPNIKLIESSQSLEDNAGVVADLSKIKIPETGPFLGGDDLKNLEQVAKVEKSKIALIRARNPWLKGSATYQMFQSSVKYLREDGSANDYSSNQDLILDEAVTVASEYAVIGKMLSTRHAAATTSASYLAE